MSGEISLRLGRRFRRVIVLGFLVIGLWVVALAGCGSEDKGGSGTSAVTALNADVPLSEEDIAKQAGFQHDGPIAYEYQGCQISVILPSPDYIQLYAEAGDTVITDPTGTIGAKIYDTPECVDSVGHALAKVELP